MNELQRKIVRQWPSVLAVLASIFSISIFFYEFKSFASLEVLMGLFGASLGVAIAYIFARLKDATNLPKIFISYAHEDIPFVKRLYQELRGLPVVIMWDKNDIQVGDDIKKRLEELLKDSDYLIFVNSKNSSGSEWATKEIQKALEMKKKVLPVVTDEVPPPEIIKNILYADFSDSFDEGMSRLVKALRASRDNKPSRQPT